MEPVPKLSYVEPKHRFVFTTRGPKLSGVKQIYSGMFVDDSLLDLCPRDLDCDARHVLIGLCHRTRLGCTRRVRGKSNTQYRHEQRYANDRLHND